MRLGDLLVRKGWAEPGDIDEAVRRQTATGKRLGETLVEMGVLTEARLTEALAEQWSLPAVAEISDDMLDPALVDRLPVEWVRQHGILPARWNGRPVALMADPRALPQIEVLTVSLGTPVQPTLAPPTEIRRAVERVYLRRGEGAGYGPRESAAAPASAETVESTAEDLLRGAEGTPVTRLVNSILLDAVRLNASDVHLEPAGGRLRIRFRLDGRLYERPAPPKALEAALVSRLKVMARLDIAEKRLPQDGSARVRIGEREWDLRVSTVPIADGERIVLRLLRRDAVSYRLEELGMRPEIAAAFRQLLQRPQGMLLVTGPTGSGKTTTLYAALAELDTQHLNVITIEDPIEYQLPNISQIQIHPRIDLTFARCLRHVLRQDPDVILVGETRDTETAEIAVRAALTGHLVLTTVHTNDAASAAQRLIDMGVPPYLLADALCGVLAQRLVRRLCPRCRREAVITEEDAKAWGPRAERLTGRRHFLAQGCEECLEGYRGRLGLFEFLPVTESAADCIRRGARRDELRAIAAAAGWPSLIDEGLTRVLEGVTSLAEVCRVVGIVA